MKKQDKINNIVGKGWTQEGAEFMSCKRFPDTITKKLFGKFFAVKEECVRCGYVGPALDRHHIHGRKNSDETIVLCANCHREVHAGVWQI
jgi:hypothetical protein